MANVREGFIFYVSFREAIRGLPAEQQLALYNALADYALYDKEPDFGDDGVAKGFFALMKPQIIANNHKRENGLRGGRPAQSAAQERRKNQSETNEEPTANQDETKAKPKEKEKVKAKVNAKVKEKVKAKANAKAKEKAYCADAPRLFSKPTVDEIRAYCRERGYAVDPQRFFDFYEAKGWRIGNQLMQDWQAALRTWEERDLAESRCQQGGSTKRDAKPKFEQHDCTDDELSHLLVDLDANPQERAEEGQGGMREQPRGREEIIARTRFKSGSPTKAARERLTEYAAELDEQERELQGEMIALGKQFVVAGAEGAGIAGESGEGVQVEVWGGARMGEGSERSWIQRKAMQQNRNENTKSIALTGLSNYNE